MPGYSTVIGGKPTMERAYRRLGARGHDQRASCPAVRQASEEIIYVVIGSSVIILPLSPCPAIPSLNSPSRGPRRAMLDCTTLHFGRGKARQPFVHNARGLCNRPRGPRGAPLHSRQPLLRCMRPIKIKSRNSETSRVYDARRTFTFARPFGAKAVARTAPGPSARSRPSSRNLDIALAKRLAATSVAS